jgi:hypothetical protein
MFSFALGTPARIRRRQSTITGGDTCSTYMFDSLPERRTNLGGLVAEWTRKLAAAAELCEPASLSGLGGKQIKPGRRENQSTNSREPSTLYPIVVRRISSPDVRCFTTSPTRKPRMSRQFRYLTDAAVPSGWLSLSTQTDQLMWSFITSPSATCANLFRANWAHMLVSWGFYRGIALI